MLGLGFPGGPALDRLAQTGDPSAISFPKSSLQKTSVEFSFSGLKTALLYKLQAMGEMEVARRQADLAAGYQEAIVRVLVDKALMAVQQTGIRSLAVVGGVSANSRLRALLHERAQASQIRLSIPPLRFCTDNAAMVAAAGREALAAGHRMAFDAEPLSTLEPALTAMSPANLWRSPISELYGQTSGLRAGQVAAVERLYRRRVPQDKVLSLELAKAMCQLSLEIRRPLAVLLTRRGQVQEIIIGTDLTLSATTLSKFRAGSRSLRGLRLIRTQLHDQPLSQESLTDLAYLRLDLFGVVSVTPDGQSRDAVCGSSAAAQRHGPTLQHTQRHPVPTTDAGLRPVHRRA